MKKVISFILLLPTVIYAQNSNRKGNIEFSDREVKSICINNWDTNGDGELSYEEAESVTELGNSFIRSTIDSFDEFQYFTGITSITGTYYTGGETYRTEGSFEYCSRLKSIILPNSLTYIGAGVFHGCSSLTEITIPNNVKELGSKGTSGIFEKCTNLEVVNLPNTIVTIPSRAFDGCSKLNNITIPNSVETISRYAFGNCENLESIVLPEALFHIKEFAFYGCKKLQEISIPKGTKEIGESAFEECASLKHVSLPQTIDIIKKKTFWNCSSLRSVSIPNSVTSIEKEAFAWCTLNKVISEIEDPQDFPEDVFSLNTYNNATLFVPVGTIEKYKTKAGWNKFINIEEGTGDDTPGMNKCEKPTISYSNGKLVFASATDGAVCHSTITDTDITSYTTNEVQLGVTYNISVYATKTGFENSEVATATLCWIDVEPKTEGITGVASVRANAVLIQSNDGVLSISGVEEGTLISIYNTAGQMVGSAKTSDGTTNIGTTFRNGEIGIVKIGEKAVKVLIK